MEGATDNRMRVRRAWLIIGAFAALYIIWGSTYLAIKYAIQTLPPLGMAGTRFVLAGAIMYAWARWRGTPNPTRRQLAAATVVGLLLFPCSNALVVLGQRTVPSGIASLIIASQTIWIAALSGVVPAARRVGWRSWVGALVGLAGLGWLLGFDAGRIDAFGATLLVIAALNWSVGSVVGQGLQRRGLSSPSLVMGTAMQMLAGGVGLLVFSTCRGEWAAGIGHASLASIAGWLYLIVFGSIIAFTAWVWLMSQVSASAVATYSFVNPVVALLLGWAIAGEVLSGRVAAASAVIVAGVALIVLDGLRAANGASRLPPPQPQPPPTEASGADLRPIPTVRASAKRTAASGVPKADPAALGARPGARSRLGPPGRGHPGQSGEEAMKIAYFGLAAGVLMSGSAALAQDAPGNPLPTPAPQPEPANPPKPAAPAQEEKLVYYRMTTSMGDIALELDAEKAPITTRNFASYADKGFYNGTIFHRVMDGFMIQGGGFTPDMQQKKTDPTIKNEWKNGLKNKRGTISMARLGGQPDSASSQFFINVVDNGGLDQPQPDGAAYAVFGKVVSGMEVVDKIKVVKTGNKAGHQNVPIETVTITKVSKITKEEAESPGKK